MKLMLPKRLTQYHLALIVLILISSFCVSVFLSNGTAGAQGSGLFLPYVNFDVGSWPEAVAIGDVNGDGRNDVVMTTSRYFDPVNDFKIHVFLQNASGSLDSPIRYAGGNGESVVVEDLNNDDKADIATTVANGIGVYYQNASGTPGSMVTYPSSHSSNKIVVGDFNADGLSDVASIDAWGTQSDHLDIFLQNSGGTFNGAVSYSFLHGGDLDTGDVNNDGLTDIITGRIPLGIMPQNQDGTLGPPVYYDIAGSVMSYGVAVGDINSDTLDDVLVTYGGNRPNSFIAALLQNYSGTLNAPISYPSYDIPEPIESADVNANGKDDVLVVHGGWTRLGVYLQTPDGSLASEDLYSVPYASHYNPHGLAVGDISGDGNNDVVIADYNHGLVVLYSSSEPPPAVIISNPTDASTVSGTVTITAVASDDVGISKVEFYIDNVLQHTDAAAPYEFSWDTTLGSSGAHSVKAIAYNALNQTATDINNVTVDQPPRVIMTTYPAEALTVRGTINVTAFASDDVGISKVEFYIDNVLQHTDAAAPYEFSWDTTLGSSGAHSVKAIAYDTLNQTATDINNVMVDQPPTITITNPPDASTVSGTVNATATASDDAGVSRVDFYVDDLLKLSNTTAPYVFSWNTALQTSGAHSVKAIAYDTLNQTATDINNVTVDQPPAAPGNLSVGRTGNCLNLSWASSADDMGVAGYEIERSLDGVNGWANIGTTGDSTFTDKKVLASPNQAFYYRVTAYDTIGQYSGYSDPAYYIRGSSTKLHL